MEDILKVLKRYINKSDVFFYLIIGVVFYILDILYVQVHDDILYAFFNGNRVSDLHDALISQCHAYFHTNGRFIVHTIVAYFCGSFDKTLYFIGSSILFVVLNLGIVIFLRKSVGYNSTDKYIVLFSLLLFIPHFGITFLGHIAMVVNYMWTAAFIVWFILLFRYVQNKKQISMGLLILSVLYSVIVGSLQESFSIGLCAGLFVMTILKKEYRKKTLIYISSAFIIGSCIGILAPANFLRYANFETGSGSITMMTMFTNIARVIIGGFLPVILLILCFFCRKRNIVKANLDLIISIVVALLFSSLVAFTGIHQLTFPILLSIILLIVFLYSIFATILNKCGSLINIVISVTLILCTITVYSYRSQLVEVYNDYMSQANKANNSPINAVKFVELDRDIIGQRFLGDYTNVASARIYHSDVRMHISRLASNGKSFSMVSMILPDSISDIVNMCSDTNKVSRNVFKKKDKHYFIVRFLKEEQLHKISVLTLKPISLKAILEARIRKSKIIERSIEEIYPFVSNQEYTYYIIYTHDINNPGWKVVDVSLK